MAADVTRELDIRINVIGPGGTGLGGGGGTGGFGGGGLGGGRRGGGRSRGAGVGSLSGGYGGDVGFGGPSDQYANLPASVAFRRRVEPVADIADVLLGPTRGTQIRESARLLGAASGRGLLAPGLGIAAAAGGAFLGFQGAKMIDPDSPKVITETLTRLRDAIMPWIREAEKAARLTARYNDMLETASAKLSTVEDRQAAFQRGIPVHASMFHDITGMEGAGFSGIDIGRHRMAAGRLELRGQMRGVRRGTEGAVDRAISAAGQITQGQRELSSGRIRAAEANQRAIEQELQLADARLKTAQATQRENEAKAVELGRLHVNANPLELLGAQRRHAEIRAGRTPRGPLDLLEAFGRVIPSVGADVDAFHRSAVPEGGPFGRRAFTEATARDRESMANTMGDIRDATNRSQIADATVGIERDRAAKDIATAAQREQTLIGKIIEQSHIKATNVYIDAGTAVLKQQGRGSQGPSINVEGAPPISGIRTFGNASITGWMLLRDYFFGGDAPSAP